MSAELVTIREEHSVWGVDRTQRLTMSDLASFSHIQRLFVDRAVVFGMDLDGRHRFQPIFADAHNGDEMPLIMQASGRGVAPWAKGRLRVDTHGRRLVTAEITLPNECAGQSTEAVNGLLAHVAPALLVGPHYQVFVNGRLGYGFWTRERALSRYLVAD